MSSKKTKSLTNKTSKISKKISWFTALVIISILGLLWYLTGGINYVEGLQMKKYLNDKYGQEFIVENVHLAGVGLGVKGAWRAEAYPKLDPMLRFDIRRDQGTGDFDYETFLRVLWSRQGSTEVDAFLARNLSGVEGYSLEIDPGRELYNSIKGETPDLEVILKKHKSSIGYTLNVRDVVTVESDEPSEQQLENALKVVNFVKQKKIDASYVKYSYKDVSSHDRKHTEKQQYPYTIELKWDELNKVNSTDSLKRYFKIIE